MTVIRHGAGFRDNLIDKWFVAPSRTIRWVIWSPPYRSPIGAAFQRIGTAGDARTGRRSQAFFSFYRGALAPSTCGANQLSFILVTDIKALLRFQTGRLGGDASGKRSPSGFRQRRRMRMQAGAGAAKPRPTVHELQKLAKEAALRHRRRRPRPSRAARLHLIDLLSRSAASGLAVFAGIAIFVSVSASSAYPLRAGVWAAMVFAALYLCRTQQQDFRAGGRSASRPFRWRANYTSSMSVLSAAFGAGAVIVIPGGAPAPFAFEAFALMLAASLACALLHAAHGRTAIAASAPAAAFIFLGVYRTAGPSLTFTAFACAAAIGAAAIYLCHRFLSETAIRRFPRTGLLRREKLGPASARGSKEFNAGAKASA